MHFNPPPPQWTWGVNVHKCRNLQYSQEILDNVVESINKSKEEEITYEKCTPLAETKKKKNPLEGNCQCDRCIRLRENCVKLNVSENLTHVDMHKE